jgi:pyruvate dehydrogenase E2 component (dihydrolipoamide acetyltransferase)
MPEVAAGATEIVLSKWQVGVGSAVKMGDILAEMETEKAIVDYAAETNGVVHKILVADGSSVEVGSPILILLSPGEDGSAGDALLAGPAAAAPVAEKIAAPLGAVSSPVVFESPAAVPTANTLAPNASEQDTRRKFVSPIVRKIARQRGIEIAQLAGTGPQGRVVRRDLEEFLASGSAATASAPAPVAYSSSSELAKQDYSSGYVTVPHTGMRRAIARRLTESKTTIPHFYLTADCKVDALLELRKSINETSLIKISVNDIVVKAVGSALMDVPESNVIWNDEAMHRYESADISIAVTTEGGLFTPVVRGVEKRSLSNLSLEISELASRARAGKLRQEDLEGGSFAVSNLGMFGTQEFSAILNPPQSGILAVGAASPRAIVEEGQVVVANIMTVTLSADHRAVDGALAAQWLSAFVKRIENPLSMLI